MGKEFCRWVRWVRMVRACGNRVRSSEGVSGGVGALLRVCGSCGIQPLPPFTTVNKQMWVSQKQWRVQLLSCVRTPLATLEP